MPCSLLPRRYRTSSLFVILLYLVEINWYLPINTLKKYCQMLWPTAGMYNSTFVLPDMEKQFTVEKTILELLSTFLYQKDPNTRLISLKTTLSRYVVLYSISSESGNMPDTWKYRKERYWTSFRIDILLASIQHHRKS